MDYLHIQADNPWYNYYIIHSLPADIWKQFGPRSDLIESQALSGSKLFGTLMVFLEEFFVCCVDALHSSLQFFSHVRMFSGLPDMG